VSQLTAGKVKCFEVRGNIGLHGFVFAASIEFSPRQSRADVTEAEPCLKQKPRNRRFWSCQSIVAALLRMWLYSSDRHNRLQLESNPT